MSAWKKKNIALRNKIAEWQKERMKLVEKNDKAKAGVEAMVRRLKALEQES